MMAIISVILLGSALGVLINKDAAGFGLLGGIAVAAVLEKVVNRTRLGRYLAVRKQQRTRQLMTNECASFGVAISFVSWNTYKGGI